MPTTQNFMRIYLCESLIFITLQANLLFINLITKTNKMKKTLLLCDVALCSLVAKAGDGLLAVGANVIVLPSTQYDGDIEWKAWTWVYNSSVDYGEWTTDNPNYNMVFGEPSDGAEGRNLSAHFPRRRSGNGVHPPQ